MRSSSHLFLQLSWIRFQPEFDNALVSKVRIQLWNYWLHFSDSRDSLWLLYCRYCKVRCWRFLQPLRFCMQSYSKVWTTKIPNCLNCIERLVVTYHLCALKAAMEFQVFNYIKLLGGPPLVVCKQCQHAVWPREIGRHFRDTEHDLPKKIIRQIITTVQEREELYQYPSQLDLPIAVEHPFKSLQVRHNGLLCQFQPECCHYVCCKEESIQKHLRQAHHASQYGQKKWPTRHQQEWQETADGSVPWVSVTCQRFFHHIRGHSISRCNSQMRCNHRQQIALSQYGIKQSRPWKRELRKLKQNIRRWLWRELIKR